MEIKFVKELKQGNYSFSVFVDGKELHTHNSYLVSRQLTGTTSEDGAGLFYSLRGEAIVTFEYGVFAQKIKLEAITSNSMTVKESVKAFKRNVAAVKEWLNSLPRDFGESVTFEM